MIKHDCLEHYIEDRFDRSDTKNVSIGHCQICQCRMLKIFRYLETYERGSLKKLDPKPQEHKFKRASIGSKA